MISQVQYPFQSLTSKSTKINWAIGLGVSAIVIVAIVYFIKEKSNEKQEG